MELKPYNIYVSVSFPPDTDTEGYREEMKTKPWLTAKLSETGSLFTSQQVASDIIRMSSRGWFAISTGMDGWLLKLGCAGMSPVNSYLELFWQVLMAPYLRFVGSFYLLSWDSFIRSYIKQQNVNRESEERKKQ